jgi:hypothetical protein
MISLCPGYVEVAESFHLHIDGSPLIPVFAVAVVSDLPVWVQLNRSGQSPKRTGRRVPDAF